MKLLEFLSLDNIKLELVSSDKVAVIHELIGLLCGKNSSLNVNSILESVLKREVSMSTSIGDGIAIPHAKCDSATELKIAFGRSKTGIDFNASDGKPSDLIFLIVAPVKDNGLQLKVLAMLARYLKDGNFLQELRDVKSPQEVLDLFKKFEEVVRL